MSCIFGPVPSRRLGRSLGVDLVPFKTCTYNCIYCQLGPTSCKTIERREYIPLAEVITQLKDSLHKKPDYITLSGSGEPTLYLRLGELIENIKQISDIPLAVLTNGSLLWLGQVRRELSLADLVIPTLAAGDKAVFEYINRPHAEISFDKMVQGEIDFRRGYKGQIWLEVFLINGVNTGEPEIGRIIDYTRQIAPDRVQLNTVTRPPTEKYAHPVPPQLLKDIARRFDVPVDVVEYTPHPAMAEGPARREDIMQLLSRRPCSLDDIAEGLGVHKNEILKYLDELTAKGQIDRETYREKTYYRLVVQD
jgi:wyosine [tRNA(Phe)-imidazoG37] synthetase (radical SAM superfamily)